MHSGPLRFLIAASLLANAVLAARFASRIAGHWTGRGSSIHSAPPAAASLHSREAKLAALAPDTWERLVAEGDRTFAARLRDTGFPHSIVSAMIGVRVHEQLAGLQQSITDARIHTPFWRRHLRWTYADEKIRAVERLLAREQTRLTREFGDDLDERDESNLRMDRMYLGDLPVDSLLVVKHTEEARTDQRNEINERGGGVLFRDELDELAQLERDNRKALAAVLSPEEFAELDRRRNPTANRLRSNTPAFKPTDAEWPALIALQQPFDERYRNLVVLSPAQAEERATARAELNRQTESLLGSDRFAVYLDAVEKDWVQASRFTLAHQLPPAATEQILAIQADIYAQTGFGPYYRRQANQAALFTEATERLDAALGAENATAYRDGPGKWFHQLQPPPSIKP